MRQLEQLGGKKSADWEWEKGKAAISIWIWILNIGRTNKVRYGAVSTDMMTLN